MTFASFRQRKEILTKSDVLFGVNNGSWKKVGRWSVISKVITPDMKLPVLLYHMWSNKGGELESLLGTLDDSVINDKKMYELFKLLKFELAVASDSMFTLKSPITK